MDRIVIMSGDFSFEEFANQSAEDVKLMPDQHGLDAATIFSVAIPIVYDVIKELIKYLNKKKKEKEMQQKLMDGKDHKIRILLPNDIIIEIPLTDGEIDVEKVYAEVQNGCH